MVDLTTRYLGMTLKNPLIAASSGLTASIESIKELERNGIGAVVLKSIFEEEILHEHEATLRSLDKYESTLEYLDYYDYKLKEENIGKCIRLIEEAKKSVTIPIIASVNCISSQEWTNFAKKLQAAGADAIELNIFIMPSDITHNCMEIENMYIDIIKKVMRQVSIPVSVKMSHYFTSLGSTIQRLSETGIAGLVLFNRFYSPDFNIDSFTVHATNVLSSPDELTNSLRWIAIMSDRVECDLAASTGIHDGSAVIKQLLAGANAVQLASVLYKKGFGHIETMLQEIEAWMAKHKYTNIDQFKGKMCQSKTKNPAEFERIQFMRYFADRD